MIPALSAEGRLPRGRFSTDLSEVETTFVTSAAFNGSATREAIWTDFRDFVAAFESLCRIEQLWLSGSFVTSKLNPGDVDVVLVVQKRVLDGLLAADPAREAALGRLWGVARNLERLDPYLLAWVDDASADPSDLYDYQKMRGYWDDFWQRDRDAAGRLATPHEALPKRGYLEVNLHDFEPW